MSKFQGETDSTKRGPMNDLNDRIAGLSPAKRGLLELRLKMKGPTAPVNQTIPRRENGNPVPLSFAQERLWFLDQFKPERPLYNAPKALRLSGALNLEALQRTLDTIVARHEILRTNIVDVDGGPTQVITENRSVNLRIIDLSGRPDGERQAEMYRLLNFE